MKSAMSKLRTRTGLVTLLFALAMYGGNTAVSRAFGYSSADVVGTWTCTYVVQGTFQGQQLNHRSPPIKVNMLPNGNAVATVTNASGQTGTSEFKWTYQSTGANTGIITDPPGTGKIVWQSRDHVDVTRVRQGTGLTMFSGFDCTRG
jgi:hypothetical protein